MATQKICIIAGCGKKIVVRGWCSAHYHRWQRYGDPLRGRPSRQSYLRWLKAHRLHKGRACLIWPFFRCGYGRAGYLMFKGKQENAARIMCRLAHGAPFKDAFATHTCGNGHGGCVNPQHLRWATAKQNQSDRVRHGTDLRGEKHPNTKFTRNQILTIRRLISEGWSKAEVARKFGTRPQHISNIAFKRIWAWLP
jgi:hypothetical protein